MFKVPNWENDVPKATNTFGKKINKKKETVSGNLVSKNNNISNKSIIINGIRKPKSEKYKEKKRNLNQISQIDKTLTDVNNVEAKNVTLNGIKNNFKNKISTNENIKRIKETIKNVNSKNNDSIKNENINTRKVLNSKLKERRKNSMLQVVEFETTTENHKLEGNNYHNQSDYSNHSNKKSKKNLDNKTFSLKSDNKVQSDINKNGIKRKHNNTTETKRESSADSSLEGQNINSDLLDEAIINVKKKKLNEAFENDDREDLLFAETNQNVRKINTLKSKNEVTSNKVINKIDKKKEIIKKMLQSESHRRSVNISGNNLRTRMLERLKAAQFRYLNEKLYTSSGSDAQKLFQSDPIAFQTYHEGYQQQLKKWPVNPLDVIVKRIQKMPKSYTIADLGCGEAALSKRISHTVRSFDLVAMAPDVEACDMAHTPLLAASTDVVVYCLALMGTELTQYLIEANRILKIGGHLLIAEVESRFNNVEDFTKEVERLGFKLKNLDKSNSVFFFMEFTKTRDPPAKRSKLPMLTLKPCIYKKR